NKLIELRQLFEQVGIDHTYYVVVDSTSDLPYDVYRPGGERDPIYLQIPSGELKELSTYSVLVNAITGKTKEDHKLYYPKDLIESIEDKEWQQRVNELLHYR